MPQSPDPTPQARNARRNSLPSYARDVGRAEFALRNTSIAGPIVAAETLEETTSENWLAAQFSGFIDFVIGLRKKSFRGMELEFVLTESAVPNACVARYGAGHLIAVTKKLLYDIADAFLKLSHTQAFGEFFSVEVVGHDFAGGQQSWLDALLEETPEPTPQQYAAALELARIAVSVLVHHEIGHALNRHFGVFSGAIAAIEEGGATGDPDPDDLMRQCLEIDADGFAMKIVTLDCIAEHYPPMEPDGSGRATGWTGSLVAFDLKSRIRSVLFAQFVLWAVMDRSGRADRWNGKHPPPMFRCLAALPVVRATLAQIPNYREHGAPEVDLRVVDVAFEETRLAYLKLMRELGSDVPERMREVLQEHLDAHADLLQPEWQRVKPRLRRLFTAG